MSCCNMDKKASTVTKEPFRPPYSLFPVHSLHFYSKIKLFPIDFFTKMTYFCRL